MPFLIAAFETAMAAEAAAAVAAASMFGAEVLGAAAVPELAAVGAEALGTAGTAAAIPEAAMGINAINPELFASAVNSGAVNPATAFSDIPGLADKLANLPAGEALSNPNALAEANRFGASPMANQGITAADTYLPAGQDLYRPDVVAEANRVGAGFNQGSMGNNPYAQITANTTSGPMPAAGSIPPPAPASVTTPPVPAGPPPPAPPTATAAPGGSYVEATGSPNPEYFRSPTPTEPPGFFDKLSDALSPLQKGFQTAQKFAKENPLATGIGSTIASRMFSSGDSMPDTTYNGPLSKFKLSPNFKGRFADPRSFRTAASGGIIDYSVGGTTEKPLVHADMGIVVDNDPDTKYLNPVAAARKRAEKLRKRYGISIPEMQAPTPIDEVNVGPRTAAHGGIMQVKRFMEGGGGDASGPGDAGGGYGGDAGYGGGFDSSGADAAAANAAADAAAANAAANLAAAESAAPGGVNAPSDAMANAAANLAAAESAAPGGVNYSGGSYGSGGGNYGGGSGAGNGIDSIEPPTTTTTPTKPKTNIDNLKPQHVNPKDFRSSINSLTPTTDPYAHYKNYNDADYNYLRTPSMPVRNTAPSNIAPSNIAPSNIAPSNTSMTDFFNDLRKNNLNTGQINREYGRPENFGSEGSYIRNNNLAQGGIAGITPQGGVSSLGGYARGGMPRLLDGPGDGMSDNIPATINDRQPARLADGEFVIPADVVSHLGNGSTKAGSKRLHLMMDQVRQARTGNPKQGKRINPNKFMPK